MRFARDDQALVISESGEVVRVEPWGPDAVRVRATVGRTLRDDLPGALHDAPTTTAPKILIEGARASLTAGAITVEVDRRGEMRFLNTATGAELLAEEPQRRAGPGPRHFIAGPADRYRLEARFRAYEGERCYGLGQHQHGKLDQKGCVIDLAQLNTEVSIPFLLSSRGYGFLWNNPGIGRVELGRNQTRWVAEETHQLDYWVVAGDAPAILRSYADATGHSPEFPQWASGFWQSRLRYATQDELLETAREHKRRGLPISVIVADFLHWRFQGDWSFDPDHWPDPAAMVRELADAGIRLVVSVWPGVNENSPNYPAMRERGLLLRPRRGIGVGSTFVDVGQPGPAYLHFYDPSNPEARDFIWGRVREGYWQHGIRDFWLDACEPELLPAEPDAWTYHAGAGAEVGNLYPLWHEQAFFEGMRADGETEILTLCRSAWAGSQRYGAAVWSGDVESSFKALRAQLAGGMNIALSGIGWWGSDIGGFSGPHGTDTPYFRELVIRWFQFAAFTPIFRLHGHRYPDEPGRLLCGAPNEIWHFGDEAYAIITDVLQMRERLRPYVMAQMRVLADTGLPPMRPLFVDFPDDDGAALVEDQFMFGPDLLVAPVCEEGARRRAVYLPAGTDWTDPWTGESLPGGQTVVAAAPLARIPVYIRSGARVPVGGSGPTPMRDAAESPETVLDETREG